MNSKKKDLRSHPIILDLVDDPTPEIPKMGLWQKLKRTLRDFLTSVIAHARQFFGKVFNFGKDSDEQIAALAAMVTAEAIKNAVARYEAEREAAEIAAISKTVAANAISNAVARFEEEEAAELAAKTAAAAVKNAVARFEEEEEAAKAVEIAANSSSTFKWNIHAAEFKSASKLNPWAAEFVPRAKSSIKTNTPLAAKPISKAQTGATGVKSTFRWNVNAAEFKPTFKLNPSAAEFVPRAKTGTAPLVTRTASTAQSGLVVTTSTTTTTANRLALGNISNSQAVGRRSNKGKNSGNFGKKAQRRHYNQPQNENQFYAC